MRPSEQNDAGRIHYMPSHVRGHSGVGGGEGHADGPHPRHVELYDDLCTGALCTVSLGNISFVEELQ